MLQRLEVPPGYARRDIGKATLIAREDLSEALRRAIEEHRELIAYASRVPGARPLQGRQTAYAIPVGNARVVVRRNHHGGVFRGLTGSLFLWPTRAPRELALSLTLRRLTIPTPPVVAIAVYREEFLATSDVLTEEIPDSQDLGALLLATTPESPDRVKAWNATRRLLKKLAAAGARHHDLNVKNVLLRRTEDDLFAAYALDVDRVELECTRRDAYAGNRARLRRSVEKWRDTKGARVTVAEIEALRHTVPSIP